MKKTYAALSKIYGRKDAQTWAEGFTFPLHALEVYEIDAKLSTHFHGSIKQLCDHNHKGMVENRISVHRVPPPWN
jgi:hypothetical protein